MSNHNKTIFLAAGGTGGHLFPAEALATELLKRQLPVSIMTDKRGDTFKSLGAGIAVHVIPAGTFKAGILQKLRALFSIGIGTLKSLYIFLRTRPALLVGFGGYPSFPPVVAAVILRIPVILHEQNAVLGKANAAVLPFIDILALSSEGTKNIAARHAGKSVITGNPVRAGILALYGRPYTPPADSCRILVTGGSQAASVFSDILPQALALLPPADRARFEMMHQCRKHDLDRTQKAYADAGVRAEVAPFFTDMSDRLARAHLFIGRGGASTVAEIAVAGRPAIFVPYPGNADMQQKYNAAPLESRGGARIIMQPDFTAERLAHELRHILDDPARLPQMAAGAASCGRPDAVKALADLVERKIRA